MVRAMLIVSMVWCAFAAVGCGSKAESAVEEITASMDAMADRLAKITTMEQLNAAEPDLKKIGDRIKAAMDGMSELENTDEATNEAIGKKMGPAMAAARQRVMTEMARISSTIDPIAADRVETMMGM